MNIIAIGLGLFAPLGNLSTVCPTGQELRIIYEFQVLSKIEVVEHLKVLDFHEDNFRINIFQITGGTKIKTYKKLYLNFGVGGYIIKKSSDSVTELNHNMCSYIGFHIPIKCGDSGILTPEISYYSVPKSISLTLNIGVNL